MRYRAFFSYTRADDRIANWLHRQLDTYRTPTALIGTHGTLGPVPDKLHPIFRDRTDLRAGGHIDDTLQQVLEGSEALVVLCTPTAAKSRWVNHECETFLRLGRTSRLFPVIAAGEPDSGDADTECFPPALRGRGLLAADLRQIKLPNGRTIGDGRESGRLKLIAGLLGVDLDRLVERERRRQRRLMVGFGAAAAVFAIVAVVAVFLGLAAQRNAETAGQRAAVLSIASARAELAGGDVNAALLLLLESAKSFQPDGAPEDLLIAFDEALQRAAAETILPIEPGSRFFRASFGALIVGPTGAVSTVRDARGPRPFGNVGGPLLFAAASAGEVLGVRDDFSIVRLRQSSQPETLGAFRRGDPPSEPWDVPFSAAADGSVLIARTGAYGDASIQLFDPRSRALRTVADDSRTRSTGLFTQCGITVSKATIDKLTNDYQQIGARIGWCTPSGDGAGLVTAYTYGSGGNFRRDLIVNPEAAGFFAGDDEPYLDLADRIAQSGTASYLNGPMVGDYGTAAQSWSGLRHGVGAMAVGRHLVIVPAEGDSVETVTPDPIVFAAFLSDGALLIADGDAAVRIVDYRKRFAYNRAHGSQEGTTDAGDSVAASEETAPSPSAVTATAAEGSNELTVRFPSGRIVTLPSNAFSISADKRYLVNQAREGGAYSLLDVQRLKQGRDDARIADISSSSNAGVNFVGDSSDLLVINGNNVKLLSEKEKFSPRIVYRGDRDVWKTELSDDRRYLLVTEDLGGSYVGGLVYSVADRRVWRRLGTDYKWYEASFTGPRDIDVSSERQPFHVRLHTFAEAVAAARAALDRQCTAFSGTNYRQSPCWPSRLQ